MALTFRRRMGEAVVITVPPSPEPTRVTVTVNAIEGNRCVISTRAPATATVDRGEVDARKTQGVKL